MEVLCADGPFRDMSEAPNRPRPVPILLREELRELPEEERVLCDELLLEELLLKELLLEELLLEELLLEELLLEELL